MKIRSGLFSIMLVNFSGSLGFSLVIPFLVILNRGFGGNAFLYGVLGAMYPVFQFIGSPLLGRWSDVYGRKPVLFVSQLGTTIGWIFFLIALYLPQIPLFYIHSAHIGTFTITLPLAILFVSRALDGITGGNISVTQAYLADIIPQEKRNEYYGKLSVAGNIGYVIGPALAGILSHNPLGVKVPIMAAILISAVTNMFIWLFMKESLKHGTTETTEEVRLWHTLKLPHMMYLIAVYFLIFLSLNMFYTTFPLYSIGSLGWTVTTMAVFFSILAVLMAVIQGPVLTYISKKYSDATIEAVGLLALAITFMILPLHRAIFMYLAIVLFALGNGFMWPSILSMLSKAAGEKYQGAVQGLSTSAGSLSSMFGLLLGGIFFEEWGGKSFFVSGAIMYMAFFLSLRLLKISMFTKKAPTK